MKLNILVLSVYCILLNVNSFAQESKFNSEKQYSNNYQKISAPDDITSKVDSFQINCTGNNTFYAFNMSFPPMINEYEINNNSITFTGDSIPYFGSSLSISNNLSTGNASPTIYSANLSFIKYWSGSTWVQESNPNGLVNHGAGFGNYIFYLDNAPSNPSTIFRYDGITFTPLKTINKYPAAVDLAIDNIGNIFFLGKDSINFSDSLYVINSNGLIIQQYPLVLYVISGYGSFLLNDVLYLGFTIGNPTYPNQLVPVTFTSTGVVPGTPLSFPAGHMIQWDLASCNSGLPLSVVNNHQSHNFEIYPNPAASIVNIQFQQEYSGEITNRDIKSKILQSFKLKNVASFKLDISNFQSGLYIIEMVNNNRIEKSKFVKL